MVNAYALDDIEGRHPLRTTVWSGLTGELAYLEPPGEPGTFWVRQTWANGVRCEAVDKAKPMESDLVFILIGADDWPGICRHCGDATTLAEDPGPRVCYMCFKAGRWRPSE